FGAVDAAVVVTRYFGGTLLGTGGLVRAYSQAARMALTNAGVAEMALCARLSLECSYSDYDRVVRLLESVGASVKSEFLDSVEMTLLVRERDVQTVTGKLCEFTGGRIIPRLIEKHFEKVGGQKRI
ncbi:MAG: YigZ family protein, partial [Oscillospiraceae bacterium]